MKSKYPLVPIGDVCAVGDGAHSKVERTEAGVPYLTSKNIGQGTLKLEKMDIISEISYEKLFPKNSKATRRPQHGDVLIGIIGTFGNAYLYKEKDHFGFSSSIGILRPDADVLIPEFLYYAITSKYFKSNHQNHNAGSVQGYTNIPTIKSLLIPLPPVEVQRKIANTLSSLDEKIATNTQTNQTLESIAQAIFKSWFVDFEPVKAKMAAKERWYAMQPASESASPVCYADDAALPDLETYTNLAAMCAISGLSISGAGAGESELAQLQQQNPDQYQQLAETAALFPSAMVDSELGKIPEGWEVKSISDIARFAAGKIDVSKLTIRNYISTENMLVNRGGIDHATALPSVSTVPSFRKGQILISNIRPYFKKIWFARFDGGRSNDVLCLETKEQDSEGFLYNLLYQDDFFEFMMRTSKGAKMPRGDKEAIAARLFYCPGQKLMRAFSEKVHPFYSYTESLNIQSKQLSELRDSLLPKLLSGEIDLTKIENEVI